ncbi:MAG TPA: hypothetical protein VKS20_14655 [Candidatus Acidoferrales bacterium]|nr:hypothetical protein [Candidatus Acidoferrales bacterium]
MPSFILDPVFQRYCLRVQEIIEQNNLAGLTREEIGRLLEGPPPTDPLQRAAYDARVLRHANEEFEKVRVACRAMFEGAFEGWGFIWHRRGREIRWHLVAKVVNGFRTPILGYFAAGQIEHTVSKEFRTRTRSATRVQLAQAKSLESYARGLPPGPDRKALLKEFEERYNAIEIRSLRLAALNMDSGMTFGDFEQLTNPKDRRLRIFAKQTKAYVDLQRRANKELSDLIEMYEIFKQIIGKDPKELGEGAAKLDRSKP